MTNSKANSTTSADLHNLDAISPITLSRILDPTNNLSYMTSAKNVPLSPEGVDWYNLPPVEKFKYLTRYRTASTLVHETVRYQLRMFHEGDSTQDAVLIVPAAAGHNSRLVSFGEEQDVAKCAIDNNPNNRSVYAIIYKPYHEDQGSEFYEDLVTIVVDSIKATGTGKVHAIGQCQGGCLTAMTAARYPSLFASMTTVAAPIRPNTDRSVLTKAIKAPMWMYEHFMVEDGAVSGDQMLSCWVSSDEYTHHIKRFYKENFSDYKKQTFSSWYYNGGSSICKEWYLEVCEEHFKNQDFYEGRKVIHGEVVKFENITCPVISCYGDKDNISPKGDAIALKDKLPESQHTILSCKGGHLGALVGTSAIKHMYPKVFAAMNK